MHTVSKAYKEIMDRPLRNRGFIQIGLGVVAQEAQGSAKLTTEGNYWSATNNIFTTGATDGNRYATLEENEFKADGSMLFAPREEDFDSLLHYEGFVSEGICGAVRIEFGKRYPVKGLTIDFTDYYPTEFSIKCDEGTYHFANDKRMFVTEETLGNISYVEITPTAMVGGEQRLRIAYFLCGVGLTFGNSEVVSSDFEEYVSAISEETPYISLNVNILDAEGKYNVDSTDSFMNYLAPNQNVTISEGLELDDGTIEWVKMANLSLMEWSSVKGQMSFKAVDYFTMMDKEYSLGDRIYDRTAYEEAESILQDLGFMPDEYEIDDYLKSIPLRNPMPTARHSDCLQMLSNACRCVCHQDYDGKIIIRANFENVMQPEDIIVSSTGGADWSNDKNVVYGSTVVYADNEFNADGSYRFLPENGEDYLEGTGFVSKDVYIEALFPSKDLYPSKKIFPSNVSGGWVSPTITLEFEAGYIFYSIAVDFDGRVPKEMIIHTYFNGVPSENVKFTDLKKNNELWHDFKIFDKMVFEFTKGYPNSRVMVNFIGTGDTSNYTLKKSDMLEELRGTKENQTSDVAVKVFTYEQTDNGYQQVDDDEYEMYLVNTTGVKRYCENQLIHTHEQAQLVAEWLGNYYKNNVNYDILYRGDPIINSLDVLRLESDLISNLTAMVETNRLSFNGAFSGELNLRKSIHI